MYKNEKDGATIEQHLEDVSELKTRIETLKGFLKHADNLGKFDAFYKEPTKEDISYARETAEFYNRPLNEEDEFQTMKSWQQKQFEDLKSAKAFLNENKEHPLKSVLNEKIAQIEDRVLGGNRIRQFYDDFKDGEVSSGKLASKCNALVKYLKFIEKWLGKEELHLFFDRIWKENAVYALGRTTAKKTLGMEKNPQNDRMEKQLEVYLSKHNNQDIKFEHYRGIPYIADRNGNPVSVEQ
jgi:hypothetical protein